MERIGTAIIVQTLNSTGAVVKAWDLRPFGGDLLHVGLAESPLPPAGTTSDRTLANGRILRVDVGEGGVFEVKAGDPPPTLGPIGGPKATMGGLLGKPLFLAIAAGVLFAFMGRRRR
jgi:hypothetical protein